MARKNPKRTKENNLVLPVLTILGLTGPIKVKDLASQLKKIVHQYPYDKEQVSLERETSNFDQVVYNLVSHRKFDKVVKDKRLVAYSQIENQRGFILSITEEGIAYLKKNSKTS